MLQFDIADGIATSKRGLALQTDKLNVLGGGAIKLETQEIELRFKTVERTGVGLSLVLSEARSGQTQGGQARE